MRVSRETIYRSLFVQTRGVLKKELLGTCDRSAAYAGRGTLVSLKTRAVKSSMPSPLGKDLRKWKTAPFPVIGKAISLVAQKTVTSRRWWNVIRVLLPWLG
jgi:hypothetical protein